MPRDAGLWDQQFASNQKNFVAFGRLRSYRAYPRLEDEELWLIHDSVDLAEVGNTTVLRSRASENCHWHLNGGAITLVELSNKLGENYTVAELMLLHCNATKVIRHSWVSKDVIEAAAQR